MRQRSQLVEVLTKERFTWFNRHPTLSAFLNFPLNALLYFELFLRIVSKRASSGADLASALTVAIAVLIMQLTRNWYRDRDVNARDGDDKTLLMKAVWEGNVRRTKHLVARGANLEAKDYNGTTALMLSAMQGRLACLKALVVAGAGLEEKDSEGYTALIYSVSRSQVECVKALIDAGANVNARDVNGFTALTWTDACGSNKDQVIAELEAVGGSK